MKKRLLTLALGLTGLLAPSLQGLERTSDGGPTREPAPNTAPAPAPKYAGPAPYGGPGPHQDLAKQARAKADAEAQAAGASAQPATPASTPIDATTLKQTVVTAHLREAMVDGKNLLWCNTFQLAWDEAGRAFGGPLVPVNESVMVQTLNEHLASKADLDDASYLAMAGSVKDGIIGRIQTALDKKFPDHDSFFSDSVRRLDPGDNNLFAFAYLSKNLQFNTPLYKADKTPVRFDGSPVASFGVWNEEGQQGLEARAKELSVIDYVSDTDFMLELKTKATGDRLFLARLKPGSTLKETVDAAMARVKQATPAEWHVGDVFKAPAIRLHIAKRYFDVHLKKFTAITSGQTLLFEDAVQDTRFVLDEKGAILVSQAVLEGKLGDDPQPRKTRHFVCDGPFLVLLQRKEAKMPYFALWIANSELLTSLEKNQPVEPVGVNPPVAPPVLQSMPALVEPQPGTGR